MAKKSGLDIIKYTEINFTGGLALGKFSGFVFGTTAAVIISYYILAPYYSPVVNWISPYFGSGTGLMMGLVFLLLGDPLIYPIVIVAWVAIGVIVGLSARRVLGSIVSMIFVHAACWVIIIIGGLGIFFSLLPSGSGIIPGQSGGGTTSSLPISSLPPIPVPPAGTNIMTILSEPVISQAFGTLERFLSAFGSSGSSSSGSSSSLFNTIASYALPFILINILTFVISLVVASLVAHYFRKYILSRENSHSVNIRRATGQAITLLALVVALSFVVSSASGAVYQTQNQHSFKLSSQPTGYVSAGAAGISRAAFTMFAGMNNVVGKLSSHPVPGQSAFSGAAVAGSGVTHDVYDETSVNLISSDGNLYSGYMFGSNYSLPQNSVPYNSQVGMSLLLLSHDLANMPLQAIIGPSAGSSAPTSSPFPIGNFSEATLIQLLPPALLLVTVNPGPVPAQKVADEQVSYYSKVTGSNFMQLIGFANSSLGSLSSTGLPTGNSTSSPSSAGGGFFLYGSDFSSEKAAASIASSYLPSLHPDGLIMSLSNQLASGSLYTPTASGSDSGILAIGYSSGSGIMSQLGGGVQTSLFALPQGNISFCMGLFYKSDFAYGGGTHTLQLSSVIGSSPVSFSPTASASALFIFSPTGYNDLTLGAFPSGFNGTVFTDNVQGLNGSFSRQGWTFVNVSPPSQINPGTSLTYSSPLPPDVVISTTGAATGSSVAVSAVVRNLGSSVVNDLSVHFPGVITLQSGLRTANVGAGYVNSTSLGPGQSFDARFSFSAPNPGSYVLPSISYSFVSGAHTFVLQSQVTQVNVGSNIVFMMFPTYFAKSMYGLIAHLSPSTQFVEILAISYLLLTVFMILAILSEYSSHRKWRKKMTPPSAAEPQRPVQPAAPHLTASEPPPPPEMQPTPAAVAEIGDVPEDERPSS